MSSPHKKVRHFRPFLALRFGLGCLLRCSCRHPLVATYGLRGAMCSYWLPSGCWGCDTPRAPRHLQLRCPAFPAPPPALAASTHPRPACPPLRAPYPAPAPVHAARARTLQQKPHQVREGSGGRKGVRVRCARNAVFRAAIRARLPALALALGAAARWVNHPRGFPRVGRCGGYAECRPHTATVPLA